MFPFHGYSLALDPRKLAALAVLAIAVLVFAHLVARRRRRLVVSTADPWSPAQGPPRAHLGWRIQRWLTFLLHVTIALLLVAALADPRPVGVGRGGHSLAVLIDDSASMGASAAGKTRLELARSQARALTATLPPRDEAMVASFGRQLALESSLTRDRDATLEAIGRVAVGAQADDLEAAVTGAAALLRGRTHPRIVAIGDRPPDPASLSSLGSRVGMPVEYLSVGAPARNVGILAFSLHRSSEDASRLDAWLTLQASGEQVTRARFDLLSLPGDRRIEGGQIELPGGVARSVRLLIPAGNARAISAVLREPPAGPGNSLASDDRAVAVTPALPRRKVLLVSDGNLYLEGALRSFGPALSLTRIRPAELGARPAAWMDYDAVIFDGVAPAPVATAGRFLYLDPSGPGSPFSSRGLVRNPIPTEFRRDHPLLRHVALADLNIREARRLVVRPGDVVLAAALGVPLIVAREEPGLRLCALAFDLRRSDLPLRPTLPLLLANTIDWLAGSSAPGSGSSDPTLIHPLESDTWSTAGTAARAIPASAPARPAGAPFRSRPSDLFLLLAFSLGLCEWWARQRRWTS